MKDWFIHDLPVIALCLLRVVCMKFVFSMERVSLLHVSIWLMQCLLCDLCGAYGFLKAFYQICVFVFCLILCVLEQSLNNVFVVHVWLQILLHVLFEECFLVALFCWLFRLKAFQNANRMDFVHLWMVYFGLLRWSTRKCKHTDCGEAGFLLKTSQNNPWFLLNLRVSEFSWVKPEMLQCASVHVLWRHGSEARVKRNLTCRTLRTSEIGFGWAETADDFETKIWQLHFVGRCKPCKVNLQVTAS